MKNTTQLALIIIMANALFSCGGNNNKQAARSAATAAQVKEYKVLELQPRSTTLHTDYPASIEGQQNIEIRPKVDGFIEKIAVDEGAVVKKGQQLFKIKAPQFEQEVITATASVKSAEAAVSTTNLAVIKVRPLVEKDIISKYELTAAQFSYQASLAALAQAQAALSNAKTNLGYTTI
ncbi:RND family efflux transporter MFP subunit [Pedobacter sp. CG_S7]|uniref:efflux RND transporter periplasmic adaptor subunit n=1 Tax=Pedobacter sp. CG_S7 TaxID=3143930 RepID=UPI003392149A